MEIQSFSGLNVCGEGILHGNKQQENFSKWQSSKHNYNANTTQQGSSITDFNS